MYSQWSVDCRKSPEKKCACISSLSSFVCVRVCESVLRVVYSVLLSLLSMLMLCCCCCFSLFFISISFPFNYFQPLFNANKVNSGERTLPTFQTSKPIKWHNFFYLHWLSAFCFYHFISFSSLLFSNTQREPANS